MEQKWKLPSCSQLRATDPTIASAASKAGSSKQKGYIVPVPPSFKDSANHSPFMAQLVW